jgi:sugar lactone lactonase YvrE
VSDELEHVRRYVDGIDPPEARTMDAVRSRLRSAMAVQGVGAPPPARSRHTHAVRWTLALGVVVAVGLALLVPALGKDTPAHGGRTSLQDRVAQLVVDDVNATVAAGSYDMTFTDTTTPPTKCPQLITGSTGSVNGPATTTVSGSNTPCWMARSPSSFSSISGHGTVNTNPYAMVTTSDVGPLGEITLYDNGTDVWEVGGGNYGLSAPGQSGPGAPLSGYASSVEGTVGQLPGALDMQGLASGTGYLDLEAQEIQGAQPAGTGTVDGIPVTIYKLSETGLQDPDTASLTSQQIATIRAADAIIEGSGFAGETTWVSVDSEGYIREQKTQYTLPGGSTVSADTVLSDFGCAGTVLMPGQPGSSAPPPGCVSPDHAAESKPSAGTTSTPAMAATTATTTTTTPPQANAAVVPERPMALAVGPNGNLYIADQGRNEILERLADGTFAVVAGTGSAGYGGDGGPAVDAELNRPGGMAFGADGTLYFADEGNDRVRAISPSGIITTVVGTGTLSANGGFVADGTPTRRADVSPNDVAFGPGGVLYLTTEAQVLRLNADGTLSGVAGADTGQQGTSGGGGPAKAASTEGATGLAFDSAGNLYFFGFDAKTIFVVPPSGTPTDPLGDQSIYPHGVAGLAVTPGGDVVAMGEQSVVRLSPNGDQTIVDFTTGTLDGISGFSPNGIAVGPQGAIYVDTYYGNGWTNRSALVSISPDGASSQVLWEAPVGQ